MDKSLRLPINPTMYQKPHNGRRCHCLPSSDPAIVRSHSRAAASVMWSGEDVCEFPARIPGNSGQSEADQKSSELNCSAHARAETENSLEADLRAIGLHPSSRGPP